MPPLEHPQGPPSVSASGKIPCPRCGTLSDWMHIEIELLLRTANVFLEQEGPKAIYCVRCRAEITIPQVDPTG